jgi:hypothetical protein
VGHQRLTRTASESDREVQGRSLRALEGTAGDTTVRELGAQDPVLSLHLKVNLKSKSLPPAQPSRRPASLQLQSKAVAC